MDKVRVHARPPPDTQHTARTPTTEATTRLPQRATPTANRVEAAHAHHEGRGSYRGRRDREVDRQFFLTS